MQIVTLSCCSNCDSLSFQVSVNGEISVDECGYGSVGYLQWYFPIAPMPRRQVISEHATYLDNSNDKSFQIARIVLSLYGAEDILLISQKFVSCLYPGEGGTLNKVP